MGFLFVFAFVSLKSYECEYSTANIRTNTNISVIRVQPYYLSSCVYIMCVSVYISMFYVPKLGSSNAVSVHGRGAWTALFSHVRDGEGSRGSSSNDPIQASNNRTLLVD